jgi:hypothetical protein
MIGWCLGAALAAEPEGWKIGEVPHGLGTTWGILDSHGDTVSAETFAMITGDPIKLSEIRDYRRLNITIGVGLAGGGLLIGIGGGFLGYAISLDERHDAGLLLAAALLGTGLGVAGFAVAATGVYESEQVARFYQRSDVQAKLAGPTGALPARHLHLAAGPLGVTGWF